jgi:hypothetical protein
MIRTVLSPFDPFSAKSKRISPIGQEQSDDGGEGQMEEEDDVDDDVRNLSGNEDDAVQLPKILKQNLARTNDKTNLNLCFAVSMERDCSVCFAFDI